jgi:uncharacterized protein YerC
MNVKPSHLTKEELNELCEALIAIDNVDECKDFLDDLLTKQELVSIGKRPMSPRRPWPGSTNA